MTRLLKVLEKYESGAIGFSGGCDSALLLYGALKVGMDVLAVTFHSSLYPNSELELALSTAKTLGARHHVVSINPLEWPGLANNPKDRCYICKKYLFTILVDIAKNEGMKTVMDGSNIDDLKDYRPGRKAIEELSVKSPLIEAGLTKSDIRMLLKEAGLTQWNKPSFACYFSRFPYGTEVTDGLINMVSESEQGIHGLGITSARVRFHGDVARIEMDLNDIAICINCENLRNDIIKVVKNAGFNYVSIDLEGYRTGSMNEVLHRLS